jgi:hypothetical protein
MAGGCGWCSLGYGRLDYLRAMRKIARNGGGQQENGRPGECWRQDSLAAHECNMPLIGGRPRASRLISGQLARYIYFAHRTIR